MLVLSYALKHGISAKKACNLCVAVYVIAVR
jgi:hypothetical protein